MSGLNRLTEQLFRHRVGRGTDRRGGADDYDYFTAVQYYKESRPEYICSFRNWWTINGKEVLESEWAHGQCRKYPHWPWTSSGVAPSIYIQCSKILVLFGTGGESSGEEGHPTRLLLLGSTGKQCPTRLRSYNYRPHTLTSGARYWEINPARWFAWLMVRDLHRKGSRVVGHGGVVISST